MMKQDWHGYYWIAKETDLLEVYVLFRRQEGGTIRKGYSLHLMDEIDWEEFQHQAYIELPAEVDFRAQGREWGFADMNLSW